MTPNRDHTPSATFSNGNSVLELEAAIGRVAELVSSSGRWNTAGVVLLTITALVAIATAVVSGVALGRQRQLREGESKLAALKEAELNRQLTLAGKTATEAQERSLKLEKEAAEANAKLLELRKQVQWRELTREQKSALISLLSPAARGLVEISSLNGDEEGYSFAEQLQAALREAGWQTTAINSAVIAGFMPTGLLFFVSDPANPPQQVSTLRNALKKIGFDSVLQPTNSPEDSIALLVGKKPRT